MVAGDPGQGGATWALLQYLLGLRRLGHDVWFVEPVAALSEARVRYFEDVVARFGLEGRAALLTPAGETAGVAFGRLAAAASGADLLLNVSGMLADERLLEPVRLRVWLDLDPCFNQLWHTACGIDMRLGTHDRFVTVGQRLGTRDCDVPTCGVDWVHTLPPVVLERWPRADRVVHDGLTTVGNWRAYGSIDHDGRRYGQKAHSVRRIADLPVLTAAPVMPALAIDRAERQDLELLGERGWKLVDPAAVAATPDRYRDFVQGSKAELGIAKEGYVVSRCGWFSDRSACYLASGRPVVAQDTGFPEALPTGEGLLAFSSAEEGAAAIDEVWADLDRHAGAARELAEAYFDSDRVLSHLLAAL